MDALKLMPNKHNYQLTTNKYSLITMNNNQIKFPTLDKLAVKYLGNY